MSHTDTDFQEFWGAYPLKRDRLDAQRAYRKAIKGGVAHQQIMCGLDAYKRHKPGWQDWKHAATWLNKGGYLDEWHDEARAVRAEVVDVEDWWTACKRDHDGQCGNRYTHHIRSGIDAGRRERQAL